MLLAFLVVVSMWAFQDSVLLKLRPRFLALFCCFNQILWIRYVALMVLHLLVILISSHLSGLKCICQSVSQSSSLLKTSCRDCILFSLDVEIQQTIICKETILGIDFGWQVIDVGKEQ